jgi:trk system potassium uptake protein
MLGQGKGTRQIEPLKAIALSFVVIILLGALLLMMPFSNRPGKTVGFVDAVFTATSATTVTGLVVKSTHDQFTPIGHVIILLLIQIGGLGYMTLMSLLFIFGSKMKLAGGVYMQESLNLPNVGEISKFARNSAIFVLTAEVIGAIALCLIFWGQLGPGRAMEYGIFHSIAAFNNAGFDLFRGFESFSGFVGNFGVNITLMLLVIFGGIGFIVVNDLIAKIKNRNHALNLNTKIALSVTAALIILGTLSFFLLERNHSLNNLPEPVKLMASAFNTMMARTAGFSSIPFGAVSSTALLVVCLLMFIGASPGSTGGGVKTTTTAVAISAIAATAKGKADTEIFGRRIGKDTLVKAFAVIGSSLILVMVGTMVICSMDKFPLEKVLFEAISAFSLTGLSTGITPMLSTGSKVVLILLMFIGRIGTIAMLSVIWKNRKTSRVQLPEENLPVG